MNPTLSATETDALLDILERGIVLIRHAAAGGDAQRAEAIDDALHNVPRLIREGHQWGWTVAVFRDSFLAPLIERYPDLAPLRQQLDAIA
jgi:hypothetical protein